ncbi:putative Mitochondrial chaperone BCS1 [Hypsibius exemplaris]|uniref:Mitochondrial chaperone BCS1 n=1 Tax=Hypsibius exemplaris TaxID=2072580 RepID=A0A9X6RNQ6_HYPEX|nr:putative Mitochondrial chaperone BCS1 [Hypsibius exemplaris]
MAERNQEPFCSSALSIASCIAADINPDFRRSQFLVLTGRSLPRVVAFGETDELNCSFTKSESSNLLQVNSRDNDIHREHRSLQALNIKLAKIEKNWQQIHSNLVTEPQHPNRSHISQATDESLNQMFLDAPENSMILLEDVDAAFGNRADDKSKDGVEKRILAGACADDGPEARNTLSFNGLLNAIDGVASAEGRILFITTNYVEKLDSALIRPGRVDVKQYIGNATESQVERMFRRFNTACSGEDAKRFVRAIFDRPERPDVSLAQLQGMFLRFKRKPADIFSGLATLYE